MLLNNGDGTFIQGSTHGTHNGPEDIVIADFDGDGDIDLVNSNAASAGSISILLNVTDTCPIDINNDGAVDTADLGILIVFFGTANGHVDLNEDGIVDTADLGILIGAFGPCP